MLMARYDKLVKYLEEVEYHADPELQKMVDELGIDCQDAEEEIDTAEDRIREIMHFRRYGAEG
jgi:hypothetical protein